MVTVFRAHGLRVVIFVNDHKPAHVHVFGDGEAKINLLSIILRSVSTRSRQNDASIKEA